MVKVPATNLVTDAASTNGLHDIRPPLAIPPGWAWLVWLATALVLAGMAFLIYYWWRTSSRAVATVPPIPPHVRARQRLREAERFLNDPREFCILVSGIVRDYLEERFDFRAPERTTEEFLYELQGTQLLTPDQKASLGDFLQECDLVKFARYEPTETELRRLLDSAHRLIDETALEGPVAPGAQSQPPPIPEDAP